MKTLVAMDFLIKDVTTIFSRPRSNCRVRVSSEVNVVLTVVGTGIVQCTDSGFDSL